MKPLIITPVGTSLITNLCTSDERKQLSEIANLAQDELMANDLKLIEQKIEQAENLLQENNESKISKASAELNAILKILAATGQHPDTAFILIGTDTWQARQCSKLIHNYLNHKFKKITTYIPDGFTVNTKESFVEGISDMLVWTDQHLRQYKQSGYRIIFSLTAGFKSMIGYLTTIGMLFADHIYYIFETGKELLEIPRLPVEIKSKVFEKYAVQIARIYAGDELTLASDMQGIDDIILKKDGNYVQLSQWGILIWNHLKRSILGKQLYTFPYLVYSEKFINTFEEIKSIDEKLEIQEALAMLSCKITNKNVMQKLVHQTKQYFVKKVIGTNTGKPVEQLYISKLQFIEYEVLHNHFKILTYN